MRTCYELLQDNTYEKKLNFKKQFNDIQCFNLRDICINISKTKYFSRKVSAIYINSLHA